jgi:hypothetical protein
VQAAKYQGIPAYTVPTPIASKAHAATVRRQKTFMSVLVIPKSVAIGLGSCDDWPESSGQNQQCNGEDLESKEQDRRRSVEICWSGIALSMPSEG